MRPPSKIGYDTLMEPTEGSSITDTSTLLETRLFLEEICCDLCRFQHSSEDGVAPEDVRIRQEVDLGIPGAYADIQVRVPGSRPYFIEVKWGYEADQLVDLISRKYGALTPATQEASKLILMLDTNGYRGWSDIEAQLRSEINPALPLEIWGFDTLRDLIHERFRINVDGFEKENLLDVRSAIEQMKGMYAFGDQYTGSPLQSSLIWHFSFWALRRLHEKQKLSADSILPPRLYREVAVVIADLTSFSSYVRDTRDDAVVRYVLTSFYTKARRQVINSRGMLSQFVGDAVIGIFGLPDSWPNYADDALDCATALMDIGCSISHEWQRRIDQVQGAGGCHIGIAVGDLHVVPLRAFSRSHMGVVADAVNMAARLSSAAAPREIVVSNGLFHRLCKTSQKKFHEMEPVEARNIGLLQAWKLAAGDAGTLPHSAHSGAGAC